MSGNKSEIPADKSDMPADRSDILPNAITAASVVGIGAVMGGALGFSAGEVVGKSMYPTPNAQTLYQPPKEPVEQIATDQIASNPESAQWTPEKARSKQNHVAKEIRDIGALIGACTAGGGLIEAGFPFVKRRRREKEEEQNNTPERG